MVIACLDYCWKSASSIGDKDGSIPSNEIGDGFGMEYQVQLYDLQVKDLREKQQHVLLQGIRFNISVQSDLVIIVNIRCAWGDLRNYYEMRELA